MTETESESLTMCAYYSLVFDVLEPKPVGLPDPDELIQNDGGEKFSGAFPGLEHAANVQVDVVHGAVSLFHLLRQFRVSFEQLLVDVLKFLHPGQFKVRPDLGLERGNVVTECGYTVSLPQGLRIYA